jgi:predicted porin
MGYTGQARSDDTSDEALNDVRALLKQVDELSKKAGMSGSSSAAPDRGALGSGPSLGPDTTKGVASPSKLAGPPPLVFNGITLYGTVDVGIAYVSHGAPLSNTYGPSLPFVVTNYSNHSITSVADNGLSQSKVGIAGVEPLGVLDLTAVFRVETGFQPTSGRLTDGPRSLVENNGLSNSQKRTASDSSRAGQAFNGLVYAGLSSKTYGAVTFGRQNSLMADDLLKYDPQLQSQAFSPIAYSGASGGLGDTEDKTLDDTIKYSLACGPARLAVLYQFGSRGYQPEGSESVDVGADYGALSVDAVYGKIHAAITATSLTAAQSLLAPGTLAATVSDNTGYSFLATYTVTSIKLYAGYEHMKFANPEHPLPNGTVTIGGYVLSTVNNTSFTIDKILEYSWIGARYPITQRFDVTAAYYHFKQNSYNRNSCSDTSAASCSGTAHDASVVADYRFTRRFDTYAGINYSSASDGLASGFIFNTDWAPMIGVRFNF